MFRRRTSEDGNDNGGTAATTTSLTPTGSRAGATAVGADGQPVAGSASGGSTSVGKGRPTPKRSEAEANRAVRMNPPKDRREALKQQRARAKADRATSRAALKSGDDRYLTARDRGPVRRFVRDFIDSRRTVGEFFLLIGLAIVLLSLVDDPTIQNYAMSAWLAVILLIVGEGFWVATRLRRALATRFPEGEGPHEGRKGAVFYGLMRTFQLRLLRLPKPQVKPGAEV